MPLNCPPPRQFLEKKSENLANLREDLAYLPVRKNIMEGESLFLEELMQNVDLNFQVRT